VEAGPWAVRLDGVQMVEGPNYLAEQGRLTVTRRSGAAPKTVTAERRFFPAGGQTTTEVGLDFRGLDDVYVVLGERGRTEAGEPAWNVRVWWNPWARLIFLGPALLALGGVLSLMGRGRRRAVGRGRAAGACCTAGAASSRPGLPPCGRWRGSRRRRLTARCRTRRRRRGPRPCSTASAASSASTRPSPTARPSSRPT